MNSLSRFEPAAHALLRIFAGAMFCFHGVQKIFGVLTPAQPPVGSQLWFGGLIEITGGFLICIGLFTRPAAFVCSGLMAVAYFQFHWKLQMNSNFFPTINKGEIAVLYCFVFLYLACKGGGIWSVKK